MSKKRRVFDIELPDASGEENFPVGKAPRKPEVSKRRGPMAAAISENVDSLREREALAAKIRDENDALAHEHVRLKREGLVLERVPLDQIETYKLTRDRAQGDDFELSELVASIKEVGLSNPIQLEVRDDGRYELVQGFRRLSAFKQLLSETGDHEAWGEIPAGVSAQGALLEDLYRRMVDENLVRKDISFAEMAQLALNYVADPEITEDDPEKAVAVLFQSAGYQKRSYIRNFIRLMQMMDDALKFSQHIPRSLGLSLLSKLEETSGLAQALKSDLPPWESRSVKDELEVLRRYAGVSAAGDEVPHGSNATKKPALAVPSKAKTTFQLVRPQGKAKCTAGAGRLEIRLDKDFSTVDRRKLEAALQALLDQIE